MSRSLPVVAVALMALVFCPTLAALAESAAEPSPDVRQLMQEVGKHQKELEKVKENYTYTDIETTQYLDKANHASKTESVESEIFYVNGTQISRIVKKDGKLLSAHDEKKQTERVMKVVAEALKTKSRKQEEQEITLGKIMEVVDVRDPRREMLRGRTAIVFDFLGRKDAHAHAAAEDISKKLQGTVWIDEADREVAQLEAHLVDNLKVGGGLLANIQKGAVFHFEQGKINNEVWLPVATDAWFQARIVVFSNLRLHMQENFSDYKRFHTDAEQGKEAKPVALH